MYTFQSRAAADMLMLDDTAKHLLQLTANLSGNTRRKRGRKACAADL